MAKANPRQLSLVVYRELAPLPVRERPHARLLREGAEVCNTAELLQILIGGPHAETAARALLEHCGDLRGIAGKSIPELASLTQGIGKQKAIRLKACVELGRRLFTQQVETRPQIKTPADAASLLRPVMGSLEQEEVWVLMLDTRNRVIHSAMIYRGNLKAVNMRIAELFRDAIRHNAASIIIAHNHPSGDASPSADDVAVTRELVKAGKLLDIEVLDHLVIAHTTHTSLKERNLGFDVL
jgi:DNA repair protein RadC